jgi:hypothetical protein
MSDFNFTYKHNASYKTNFVEWRTLNSEERSAYNEQQLTQGEAEGLFKRMYGEFANSVDTATNQ